MNIPHELRKLRASLERELTEIDRETTEKIELLHELMVRRREVATGIRGITEHINELEGDE